MADETTRSTDDPALTDALAAFRARNRTRPLSRDARFVLTFLGSLSALCVALGSFEGTPAALAMGGSLALLILTGMAFVVYMEKVAGIRPDSTFALVEIQA